MTKRWQGPEHAHSEARRAYEQREEYRYEVWRESNPECHKCGEREHENKMTDVDGEDWCTHCVSEHAFECDVCGDTYSDEYLTDVDLTMGEYVCTDCDEKCAADKTRHHAPVEVSIGHMEHILWTIKNMAKDEPYEAGQPGNAKKWMKESIELIEKFMPKNGTVEEKDTTSEKIVRAQNAHANDDKGLTLSEYKKEQAEILGMVLRSNAHPLK